MHFSSWYGWCARVVLTASLSGSVDVFSAEWLPHQAALQDGSVSACAWPEGSPDRVLAQNLGKLSVHDETVGAVAARLRDSHDVPLSFIENDDEVKISFTMPHATVQGVLERIVKGAPAYRYGTVADHLVLYPRSTKWDARLDGVRLGPGPREKIASQLADEITRHLPVLGKFGQVIAGNTNSYVYQDPVSVVGGGSIVELMVQLLGARPSATFSVYKMWGASALFLNGVHYLRSVTLDSPTSVMRPGEKVQLKVTGLLMDGSHKDLTAGACLTVYWVSNEEIVTVSPNGLLTARRVGEAWVEANNEDRVSLVRIQVAEKAVGSRQGAAPP
jgi:hypothetical protein